MILDLRGRKSVTITRQKSDALKKPTDEQVSVGDDVEVEVKRGGNTLYKGR